MKTKIKLNQDQVDQIVEQDEKILRAKFEKDLASLRKKYEFIEIDIQQAPRVKQTEKTKLTDEVFKQYLSEKKSLREICSITGYNQGYIYKIHKRILAESAK